MTERERFYPKEENLGQDCLFWDKMYGCMFPKVELENRRSCEGIIDDVCLYLKDGREAKSLSEEQVFELKFHPPTQTKWNVPPGDTDK